jgi:formylmethanofuran dehydrogenase subunit B
MPAPNARKTTGERAPSERFEDVSCPFCGLLCDDLEIERNGATLKILKNSCDKAIAGFERRLPPASPTVNGKDVEQAKAIMAAAALIREAKFPLIGGLATDVDGMRAAMALAERSGGVIDHALSEAQYRNFKVLQTSGWITSTLTETRNRADLIIVLGDVHKMHPRFFERVVRAPDSMFDTRPPKRTVVLIGKGLDLSVAEGPRTGEIIGLDCPIERVGEVLGAVRSRFRGMPLQSLDIDGVRLADIDRLAELCRKASYGVIAWAPPILDFPHADLTVAQIADFVKDINQTSRFAGLPLGGNEGAVTAGAVCSWQSGYPLRNSYASGAPDHDPYRYAIGRMLAAGEGDLLVWISSFTPGLTPPATDLPTVVLGTPGMKFAQPPAVFIPVGTPGMDHAGSIVRCDSVVSLPLRNLHRSELPRAADILAAIEAAL